MVTYVFSLEDLARTRFAISPAFELVRSLTAMRDPASAALHLPWLRSLSGRLDGVDLRPVVALVPPSGYSPDFLTPPPDSPLGEIEEELDRIRAVRPAQVRRELEFFSRSHGIPAPKVNPARLADTLQEFWRRAHEPSWPRVRALLDADIAHRARRLIDGGPSALFDDLHPDLTWRGDRLEVRSDHHDEVALQGRGLLLMPSAFVWRAPVSITDEPWQPTVVYPARGIATLWETGQDRTPEGLARVLGSTRAALLAELDAPRSTTELARRLSVTAGGISQHLTALRGAGLVSGRRAGREVLYVRTPVADALLAPEV
jgi:DNA-binding transcriptional ArsR family regulator